MRQSRPAAYRTFEDLLLTANLTLEPEDEVAVQKVARDLPKRLEKKLVIDWRKTQRGRAAVKVAIKDALDDLPPSYSDEIDEKWSRSSTSTSSSRTGARARASTAKPDPAENPARVPVVPRRAAGWRWARRQAVDNRRCVVAPTRSVTCACSSGLWASRTAARRAAARALPRAALAASARCRAPRRVRARWLRPSRAGRRAPA